MKKNEVMIAKIAGQETKICNLKSYLATMFFPVSIVVIWIIVKAIMSHGDDELLTLEHDRAIAVKIIITLSAYATTIITGYLCDKMLSKKLDVLWERKKALF